MPHMPTTGGSDVSHYFYAPDDPSVAVPITITGEEILTSDSLTTVSGKRLIITGQATIQFLEGNDDESRARLMLWRDVALPSAVCIAQAEATGARHENTLECHVHLVCTGSVIDDGSAHTYTLAVDCNTAEGTWSVPAAAEPQAVNRSIHVIVCANNQS